MTALEVNLAAILLWVSRGLGVVSPAMQCGHVENEVPSWSIPALQGLTLALTALLVYFASAGRNWARSTFLISTLVAPLPWFQHPAQIFNRSRWIGLFSVAQFALDVAARTWFSPSQVRAGSTRSSAVKQCPDHAGQPACARKRSAMQRLAGARRLPTSCGNWND